MKTLNLKAVTSAFAALAVTMLLSLTVADASNYAPVHRDGHNGFLATISALVR